MSNCLPYVAALVWAVSALGLLAAMASGEAGSGRPTLVVDNDDEGFTTKGGGWNPSTRDPGFYGNGYLWHAKGRGEARAIWRASLPRAGRYNVYARWVMSKPADRATNARFTVRGRGGDTKVRVNMAETQSAAGTRW